MTDHEKLFRLLLNAFSLGSTIGLDWNECSLFFPNVKFQEAIDYLLVNGVTVKQTTPDSFLEKVKETIRKHDDDVEVMHSVLDELMEDVLIELGYAEAVEHIRDSERWYA